MQTTRHFGVKLDIFHFLCEKQLTSIQPMGKDKSDSSNWCVLFVQSIFHIRGI